MSQRQQIDDRLNRSEEKSKTSTIKFKDSNSDLINKSNSRIRSAKSSALDLKADSSDEEIQPNSSKRNLSFNERSNLFRDSKASSRSKKTSQSPSRRSEYLDKTINEDSDSNEQVENSQGYRQFRRSEKIVDSFCEDEITEPKLMSVKSAALDSKISNSLKARTLRQSSGQNLDCSSQPKKSEPVSGLINSDTTSLKQSSKFSRLDQPNLRSNTKSSSRNQDLKTIESNVSCSRQFQPSPAKPATMSNRTGEPNMHACVCPKYNVCDWTMDLKYEILKKMETEIMKMCAPMDNSGCNPVVKANEPEIDKSKKSCISLPLSYETILTNHLNEDSAKCTADNKCTVKSCGFNVDIKEETKKEKKGKKKKDKTDEEKLSNNPGFFKKMFNFSSKNKPKGEKDAKKKDELKPKGCKSHCHSDCTFMNKKDVKRKKKCEKVKVVRKMMVPILITEEIDDSDCDNEFADSELKINYSNQNVRIDEIGCDLDERLNQSIGPAIKETENKEAATDHVELMDANTEIREVIDKKDKQTLTKTCMSKDVQTFTQMRQSESEERKNKNTCIVKCCCKCPSTSNPSRSSITQTRSGCLQNKKSTLPNVLPGRSFSCRCKKENQFNSTKAYPVKICYNDSKSLINNRILSEVKQTHETGSKKCPCCLCIDNETVNQSQKNTLNARKCLKFNCHDNSTIDSDVKDAPPMICVYCDQQKGTCNCTKKVQSFFESRGCDSNVTIESNPTTPFSSVLTELQKRISSSPTECNCNCETNCCRCICETNCCTCNSKELEGRLNEEGSRKSLETKSKTTVIPVQSKPLVRPAAKCYYCKILPCRCPSSVNVFKR